MGAETKMTISIAVTDGEAGLVREAAHGMGMSNSAWMAARVAAALSSPASWSLALSDVTKLAARGVATKERRARVSTLVDHGTHGELTARARMARHTTHEVVQAIAVMGAERALEGQPVSAERAATRQVETACRELDRIRDRAASHADVTLYLRAGERLSHAIMGRGHIGHGMKGRIAGELERLPRELYAVVQRTAGWIGQPPDVVYAAVLRRASDLHLAEPGASTGPEVVH